MLEQRVLDLDQKSAAGLGQDIGRRIIARKQAMLQSQFLKVLQEQPFSRYLTLTGSAALHGVYLRQPWGSSIELTASPAVAARFGLLATAFGERMHRISDNRYLFRGQEATGPDPALQILITPQRKLPSAPEQRLFVPVSAPGIPVNVVPLALAVQELVKRMHKELTPVDVLDLWLLCRTRLKQVQVIIAEMYASGQAVLPAAALTAQQRQNLEAHWGPDLENSPFVLPSLSTVIKGIQEDLHAEMLSVGEASAVSTVRAPAETFMCWRDALTEGVQAQFKGGDLSQRVAEASHWGEASLEALLHLVTSPRLQVRLTTYEMLLGLLDMPVGVSETARRIIFWTLEDALRDEATQVKDLAHAALQQHLMEARGQAQALFPHLSSQNREMRATALRSLRVLPLTTFFCWEQATRNRLEDCLGQSELPLVPVAVAEPVCLVVLSWPGQAALLEECLHSLTQAMEYRKVAVAVLTFGDEESHFVAMRDKVRVITCDPITACAGRGPLFSAARLLRADKYICFDSQAVVEGSLFKIADALDALDENSLMVVAADEDMSSSRPYRKPLAEETLEMGQGALTLAYTAWSPRLFAGHRAALLALDETIRRLNCFAPKPLGAEECALFSLAAGTNERLVPLNTAYLVRSRVPAL